MHLRKIASRKYFVLLSVLLVAATTAYAANVTILTPTYQAYQGVLFNVKGNFTASLYGSGFYVAHVTQTANSSCTWTNNGECHTAITAGHWVLIIKLTTTTSVSTSQTLTLTVSWNYGSSVYPYTLMNTITITGTYSNGQSMYFTIDTGVSSFSAPTGIVVTVQ